MTSKASIQSTAGAVPIRTDKGFTMEKVKVTRYIAGKMPEYAQKAGSSSASSDESEDETGDRRKRSSKNFQRGAAGRSGGTDFARRGSSSDDDDDDGGDYRGRAAAASRVDRAVDQRELMKDPRMRRLLQKSRDSDSDDDQPQRRHIAEPEIVRGSSKHEANEEYDRMSPDASRNRRRAAESSDEVEEDELPEEEVQRRRALLRMKNVAKEKEDLLGQVEESNDEEEEEDEETEYEESDSEDDDLHRLKPVFVRKKDRVTLADGEKEEQKQREKELRKKFESEERKRQSTKLVEDLVKLEMEMEKKKVDADHVDLNSVCTDDENEELAYEAWKVRELKRVKRAKEEREQQEKEKAEIDKVHSMTEDERRAYLRANPKLVTNKQQKGKYKFLQKYYHRGVFYLDEDDEVYKRNFAEATLDDHFDRTVLPKIMQVKDFGKAGRTKWSHLVQEDTTDFQSAWHADTAQNIKFFQKHAAGIKDVFERPALKKRKKI